MPYVPPTLPPSLPPSGVRVQVNKGVQPKGTAGDREIEGKPPSLPFWGIERVIKGSLR